MIEVKPAELVSALKAVLPFAGTDSTLPALQTVLLEVVGDNLTLTTTDRYTLGHYRVAAQSDDNVTPHTFRALLSTDDAKRLQAAAAAEPKYNPGIRLEVVDGDWLNVFGSSSTTKLRLADHQFPTVRLILEGAIESARTADGSTLTHLQAFNPAYLAKFAKVGTKGTPAVFWPKSGAGKPQMVTVGQDFVGIIMIIRGEHTLPTWVGDTSTTATRLAAAS